MYGFINSCLKSLLVEKFGEETWEKLKAQVGTEDTFMTYTVYDDSLTMKLVQEACNMLKMPEEAVLKLFGQYFFNFCKTSGYDKMLRTLGGNLMEFIENLDSLHSYLALSYQKMNAPSFRVERKDGIMLLHYYSDRKGLCHIVPGIIEAVARDFFDCEVSLEILEQNVEEERTGKKEHVVFFILQTNGTVKPNIEEQAISVCEDGSQKDKEQQDAVFQKGREKTAEQEVYCDVLRPAVNSKTAKPKRAQYWNVLVKLLVPNGNRQDGKRMNKVVTVDDVKVKLQIWDTAGQERFRSVTHAYYRDAQALLLLYDITNKVSFDSIRAWLTEIHEYAQKDVVIMLLGNKADMSSERVIRTEDGESLAREYGVPFMETSAKTGLNVELAFLAIAKEIKQRAVKQLDEPRFQIHDYIESEKRRSSCCTFV